MGTSRSYYLIVGAFVLLMLAGLLFSLVKLSGWTADTRHYVTAFTNVTGIKDGTKVFYEGYPIGRVVGVSRFSPEDAVRVERARAERLERLEVGAQSARALVADGAFRTLFRLDLEVDSTWPIPENAVAEIAAPGFLSAVIVSIREFIPDGDDGTASVDVESDIVAGLPGGDFVASREVESFGGVVRTAASKLALTADAVNGLTDLAADILIQDVKPTFASVRTVIEDIGPRIPELVGRAHDVANELHAFAAELRGYTTDTNHEQLERLLQQTNQAADEAKVVIAKLNRLADAANAVVTSNKENVDKSIESFRYTMDAIARDIDGINRNLEGTSRNMYEFSRQIRQNPGVLLGGTRTNSQTR